MTKRVLAAVGACLAFAIVPVATAPQAPRLSQWDGVFTDAQAERGRLAYDTHCATCHGYDLLGFRALSPTPDPTAPSALVGPEFLKNWGDLSLGHLSARIRITMPATNPGSLSKAVVADTVAYILKSGGYPSGSSELPATETELNAILVAK